MSVNGFYNRNKRRTDRDGKKDKKYDKLRTVYYIWNGQKKICYYKYEIKDTIIYIDDMNDIKEIIDLPFVADNSMVRSAMFGYHSGYSDGQSSNI